MTLDELLTQLMKIKESYEGSGKWLVKDYNEEFAFKEHKGYTDTSRVKVISHKNIITIE